MPEQVKRPNTWRKMMMIVQRVLRLRAVYLRCVLIIFSYRWRYCLLREATDCWNPAIRERTRRTSWQWLTVSTGKGTNRPGQMGRRRTGRPYTRWTDTFKRVAVRQWSRSDRYRSELNRYTQLSSNQVYYKLRKGKQQVAAPWVVQVREGADKSLARPGRKRATATKLGIYSTYSPRSSTHFLARCSKFCKPLKKIQKAVSPSRSPGSRWG